MEDEDFWMSYFFYFEQKAEETISLWKKKNQSLENDPPQTDCSKEEENSQRKGKIGLDSRTYFFTRP